VGSRHPGRDDLATPRRGRRPERPWTLGRRSDHRTQTLGDRNGGRTNHEVHHVDPSATRGRLRCNPSNEGRAGSRRLRHRHDEGRPRTINDGTPRAAPTFSDLGPRKGTLSTCSVHDRDRHPGLLLRPAVTLAARHQREHQWPPTPVLPQRHRPISMDTQRHRGGRCNHQLAATQDPRLANTRRSLRRTPTLSPTNRCRDHRLNPPNTPQVTTRSCAPASVSPSQ